MEGVERVTGTGPVSSGPGWVLTHPDLRASVRVMTFVRFIVAALASQKAMIAGEIE